MLPDGVLLKNSEDQSISFFNQGLQEIFSKLVGSPVELDSKCADFDMKILRRYSADEEEADNFSDSSPSAKGVPHSNSQDRLSLN